MTFLESLFVTFYGPVGDRKNQGIQFGDWEDPGTGRYFA